MDDLLTAREVQELLRIDRTTVYRMLRDGRLAGVKVGQQWRFPQREVERLLGGVPRPVPSPLPHPPPHPEGLPLHCVQAIQDVFADLAGIGALTTTPDGEPLTATSNGCRFCALLQSRPAARAACRAEWAGLAARSKAEPHAAICHAGLGYLYGRIDVAGHPAAMLVGGQFRHPAGRVNPPALAARYGLPAADLAAALEDVPPLDDAAMARIGAGLRKVAATFATLAQERAAMLDRLRHIAALSAFEDA
jgi:excisionase family DNA binding protein